MLQVPHVVYEERIIEVPQARHLRAFWFFHPKLADSGSEVERRELIRHVPVSNAGTSAGTEALDSMLVSLPLFPEVQLVDKKDSRHDAAPVSIPSVEMSTGSQAHAPSHGEGGGSADCRVPGTNVCLGLGV